MQMLSTSAHHVQLVMSWNVLKTAVLGGLQAAQRQARWDAESAAQAALLAAAGVELEHSVQVCCADGCTCTALMTAGEGQAGSKCAVPGPHADSAVNSVNLVCNPPHGLAVQAVKMFGLDTTLAAVLSAGFAGLKLPFAVCWQGAAVSRHVRRACPPPPPRHICAGTGLTPSTSAPGLRAR